MSLNRAQSEVVGVVILLGISMTAIAVIGYFGEPAISSATSDVQFDRMENEFSLLDARIGSSVLGASEKQEVSMNIERGMLEANPEASWMNITYAGPSSNKPLANITMGSLRYTLDGRSLGYEGGGVWRTSPDTDNTVMVSPPEFHYRGATLTLPSYNITNRLSVSGSGGAFEIRSGSDPKLLFPDEDLDNPLREGEIFVKVRSRYYKGWETFFRERTTGAVRNVYDGNNTIVVNLDVPTELALTGGLMYVSDWEAKGSVDEDDINAQQITMELPDPDTLVDPELDKCFPDPSSNSDCESLESTSDLDDDKIYYANTSDPSVGEPYQLGGYDVEPNTTLVVNGDTEFSGDVEVEGNGDPVQLYVDGDLGFSGGSEINADGDTGNATMFETYATGEVPGDLAGGSGNTHYVGVIYAPNTFHGGCGGPDKITGNANITGSIIADNFCIQGSSIANYDPDLDEIDLSSDVSLVRYLHISENKVRVER